MTTAAPRILPVAAILAAGTVVAVWYAGEGNRTAPGPIAVAPLASAPTSVAPAPVSSPPVSSTPVSPTPLPAAPRPAPREAVEAPRPAEGAAPVAEAPRPAPREVAEAPRPVERAASAAPAREAAPPRHAEAPRYESPRFDVVRVGARGNAVVAGRASPGAEVVLFDGVREIGRARADSRGEWVILPADPVGTGAREFSLRARMPGGEEVAGADTVLVVGPAVVAEAAPAAPRVAENRPSGEGTAPAGGGAPAPAEARANPAPDTGMPTASPRDAAPASAPQAAQASPSPRAVETPTVLLLPPTARGGARPLSPSPPAGAAGAGPQVFALGLDVVDYDDSDTMRFAGSAPPGAQVRVYADDRHLGDTQADSAGRWSLAPEPAPSVGRHTLRVDQLASAVPGANTTGSGTTPIGATAATPGVASRIEVPFQREALPASFVRDGRVVVQPGNNLWRIAREAYGRGTRYTVIYRANQSQIRNPSLIYPGQVFALPAMAAEAAR